MNTQANEKEDLQQGQSTEDKFFGVTHEVKTDDPPEDAPNIEVEEIVENDDAPPAAAKSEETKTGKEGEGDEDELEGYSERVQKRINKLTWEARQAERRAKSAEDERDEAVRATQSLFSQNQQYQQVIHHGEAQLIQRMKDAASNALENAQSQYRSAYDEGDTDKIIAAQQAMIEAQGQLKEANSAESDYNFRAQQAQQQPQPQQFQPPAPPQQRQAPKVDPEAAQWAEDNPWFNDPGHRDMTAIALSEHERLIRDEKLTVNSPEYYEKIDAKMRTIFPDYFKDKSGATSAPAAVEPVVAPAQRSAPTPKSRKVKLTPSALKIAKRLGLTPEQYANQVLKDRGLV